MVFYTCKGGNPDAVYLDNRISVCVNRARAERRQRDYYTLSQRCQDVVAVGILAKTLKSYTLPY